jgi:hypothetical protein
MQRLHTSFLAYRGNRWFWIGVVLALGAIGAYAIDQPGEPPSGGTVLGYSLGTIGALLVLWLLAYGLRRRSYHAHLTTAQGWLSAHVYLGLALVVIATLHTGFQFGANVHTVAYALLLLVVTSGCWGIWAYSQLPRQITEARGGMTREDMAQQIHELDRRALQLARAVSMDVHRWVSSAIEGARTSGGAWAQLRAKDRSVMVVERDGVAVTVPNVDQFMLTELLADLTSRATDAKLANQLQDLLVLVSAKVTLSRRMRRDLRLQGLVEVWLLFHVPLSLALVAALLAHVFAVFYYW